MNRNCKNKQNSYAYYVNKKKKSILVFVYHKYYCFIYLSCIKYLFFLIILFFLFFILVF